MLLALLAGLAAAPQPERPQQPFIEHVEVARVLIDARVLDDRGRPVTDLGPSDFEVRLDGRVARVESAEWVGSPPPADEPSTHPAAGIRATEEGSRGRLVVFLVQRDLEPSRIGGLMRIGHRVEALLRPLTRDDRVAVVSFDSRLRLWTDFTSDLERVRTILAEDVIRRRPGAVSLAPDVSLGPAFLRRATAGVHGIEHALRHVAESLERLPGAKSLILLGYGFGRWSPMTGVTLMDGYDEASAALQRARVAVFTLNVTQADYNSLQAGLQTVAAETGGMYASTFVFPDLAIQRVTRALAGHYVLFAEKPDLERGLHRIDVRLVGRKGRVFARRTAAIESR